jgi:hypothetical protein
MRIGCPTSMKGNGAMLDIVVQWNNHEIGLESSYDHAQHGDWRWRRRCRIKSKFLAIANNSSFGAILNVNLIIIWKICSQIAQCSTRRCSLLTSKWSSQPSMGFQRILGLVFKISYWPINRLGVETLSMCTHFTSIKWNENSIAKLKLKRMNYYETI